MPEARVQFPVGSWGVYTVYGGSHPIKDPCSLSKRVAKSRLQAPNLSAPSFRGNPINKKWKAPPGGEPLKITQTLLHIKHEDFVLRLQFVSPKCLVIGSCKWFSYLQLLKRWLNVLKNYIKREEAHIDCLNTLEVYLFVIWPILLIILLFRYRK